MPNGGGPASSAVAATSRDAILDAAQALIAAHGYDGMAVSNLTAQSGLPASSIYYHFGNKLGVLAALLDRTFHEMHRSFPNPSSFDGHEPLERFELWFTSACRALDQRPEYLRLLLAVSVGPQKDDDTVRTTVRRIRDYAHASWVDALTPVFAPTADAPTADAPTADEEVGALVDELAVLGRAVTDGLSLTSTLDGTTYSSHVEGVVTLVRALAQTRRARG